MKDLLKNAEIEKEFQVRLRRKMINAIRNATPGYLRKKGKYYYWKKKVNDKYIEQYLGTEENPIVQRLKKKKYLQITIKTIDKNLEAIERFIKKYKPYDPISISKEMPLAYKIPPDSLFSMMGFINPKGWNQKYTRNNMFSEYLTQTTDKGDKVRSKSEVIIANALSANNILFRYECNHKVGNVWVSPDFKILLTRENRIVIWEHFGRPDNPEYMENALKKIKLYIDNGYVLWHDLIITFEDKDGSLDSSIVSKIIETCLL